MKIETIVLKYTFSELMNIVEQSGNKKELMILLLAEKTSIQFLSFDFINTHM